MTTIALDCTTEEAVVAFEEMWQELQFHAEVCTDDEHLPVLDRSLAIGRALIDDLRGRLQLDKTQPSSTGHRAGV